MLLFLYVVFKTSDSKNSIYSHSYNLKKKSKIHNLNKKLTHEMITKKSNLKLSKSQT